MTTRFPVQQTKFWSLGKFKPKGRHTPVSVGKQFTEFVHEAATGCKFWGDDRYSNRWADDYVRRYEVRTPTWHVYNYSPNDTVSEWHNDGVPGGRGTYLVLWSSCNPTELAEVPTYEDGTQRGWWGQEHVGQVYQPEPYEVVAIENYQMVHRTPQMTLEECETRWFARGYIGKTGKILDRPGVYAYEFA